ncbi:MULTISPECIES: RNA polymerase sigma factor [Rhodobacterales]|uniref:RNA polymerase subunit sigma-70 n=1 Tax=Pelagivirga sediminicola TaxID=2170575 RepID=A0A2T7G2S6_9RHOB|nr:MULTISPECIES: RNA polymerase sigma factor [Rhodobacterales]MCQ0090399.1 RNA polymerase sigma factor [Roseovarius sp. M141]PVA08698.1 RNA polymerase subunit sigma-70 [Pelagivirga sediminicola]
MFAEPRPAMPEVSRCDTEAKLIEGRNKFLGFLRKRLSSAQDAEDVFQDFCVKVLQSHATIRSGERLDAWMGITLRHTLTDYYRRRATRNRGAEAYANEAKILAPETEDFDGRACSCVSAAMRKLDPAQAELLTRLDLRDDSRKEIAADLGVSLNALGVRVHRSRAALKTKIAEFCPVCGEGRFMQCDCNHSRNIRSLSSPPQRELMPQM